MFEKLAIKAKAHPIMTKVILGVTGVLVAAGITAAVVYAMNTEDENTIDGEIVEIQSEVSA